jgi:hypothetical protein
MGRTYNDYVEIFAEKKCKLLTNEKDLYSTENIYTYTVKYTASCDHENSCQLKSFLYDNSGILCKDCAYKKKNETLSRMQAENPNISHKTEYEGLKYLQSLLSSEYKLEKSNEGALADVLFKPINEDSDKWMRIQLKVTNGGDTKQHRFSLHDNKYVDCLIVCITLEEDKKIWLFDYDKVKNLKMLCIGKTKSKYDKCEVTSDNINEILLEKYKTINKCTYDDGVKPISISQQREYHYQTLREEVCPYLIIKYPLIEQTKTDCFINEYKILEKVASIKNKSSYQVYLYVSNGTLNKKPQYKPYEKGDNDFYWFWVPNENDFYLFPDQVLVDKKFIQENKNLNNKRIRMTISETFSEYKYSLDDPQLKEKLLLIFAPAL